MFVPHTVQVYPLAVVEEMGADLELASYTSDFLVKNQATTERHQLDVVERTRAANATSHLSSPDSLLTTSLSRVISLLT